MKKGFQGILEMTDDEYSIIQNEITSEITPPNEYIVRDRMPAEAQVEANLEAMSNIDLYNSPRSSTVISSISCGDVVQRISCIVYTYPTKFPVKVLRPMRAYKKNNGGNAPAGPLLQPGTIVYLLTYTGEGTYLGWYNGEEAWWLKGYEILNFLGAQPQQPWGEYIGAQTNRGLSIEVWYCVRKSDGTTGWAMVAQNGSFFNKKFKISCNTNIQAGTKSVNTSTSGHTINSPRNSKGETHSFFSMVGKFILGYPRISFILILFIAGLLLDGLSDKNPHKHSTSKVAPASAPIKATPPIEPIAKKNVVTGYDPSKPLFNNDGLCELTIDNSRNDMPVYVRVWDMDYNVPVRAFYIAKGDEFTAYNLTPGTYEIRYIELYDNDFPAYGAKSERFEMEQIESAYGVQYSQMSLTLYKVRNGNTHTSSIPADQI